MHPRLLSFLSAVEAALKDMASSPPQGPWQTSRTINFQRGLARLRLAVQPSGNAPIPCGNVQLQGYLLPDGSTCLKAVLAWSGNDSEVTHSIYEKPGLDWNREANRIATAWLDGTNVLEEAEAQAERAVG